MIPVRNPRTGEDDHTIEPAGPAELDAIASKLRATRRDDPIGTLRAWRERLAAIRDDLIAILTHDTGRLHESVLEVDAVLRTIDRWCDAPRTAEETKPASIPGFAVRQDTDPYPLVGVISPWNFPLLLSLIDAIPALAAGCAVVVKPSEIAPRFVDVLAPTLPETLAYVVGDGATGEALIDRVDLICFTGSVPTGRRVAERATRNFIPAFLELGGKDPAVVLRSADPDHATSAILWGSTANAGQSCQSIERVYVDAAVHDRFVELLTEKASRVTLAVPAPGDGHIGPIIAARQVDTIARHLSDAYAKGATALTGGEIETHGGGSYVRPTVLTGVDHSMLVMTEETFGPLIPVMPFEGTDEALRLANDTAYGLSAAVFGERSEALATARRIEAGAVSINDAALTALIHDGEKQSYKLSGLGGSRMGPAALKRFARRRAYLINESGGPDPWWHR